MRKLKPQTAKLLFAPTVGLVMSAAMSFVLTAIYLGFNANFLFNWLQSFGVSFLVALPISALVVPRIQRFYAGLTEEESETHSQGGTYDTGNLKQSNKL
jgi:hypothetical protein